jgi:hypothetical protein
MSFLDDAPSASECVVSVMGAHAGDETDAIFGRKIEDCRIVGRTFRVARSAKARPAQVQAMCRSGSGYAIFVEPATPGAARPTTRSDSAAEYSPDGVAWSSLPTALGPVTGQIDSHAAALVFDRLATDLDGTIDLWEYADSANPDMPLRFTLGLSTVCAVRRDMSAHPSRMKSRRRRVVAVARLAEPYCVWLR